MPSLEEDWMRGEVQDFSLLEPIATVRNSLEGWTHADSVAVWDRFWETVEGFRQNKGDSWILWAANQVRSGQNTNSGPDSAGLPLPWPPPLTPPPDVSPISYKMPRAWQWLGADDWLYLGGLDALANNDPDHPFRLLDREIGRQRLVAVLALGEAAHGRVKEAMKLYARWNLVQRGKDQSDKRNGGRKSSKTPEIVIQWLAEKLQNDPELQSLARDKPGKASSTILNSLTSDEPQEEPEEWTPDEVRVFEVSYKGPTSPPSRRKLQIKDEMAPEQPFEAGHTTLRDNLIPRALRLTDND